MDFTKYLCFYEVFSNVSTFLCESSPKTPPLMKYLNLKLTKYNSLYFMPTLKKKLSEMECSFENV